MTAAATSTINARSLLLAVASGPVPGELVGHPAAARAALQRPLQRLFLRFFIGRRAEGFEPVADDVQVLVLVEGIEADPQAEALGERDLLLDRLPRVYLVADVLGLEVFGHVLGHQVAAVGGGVDQQVLAGGGDRTVERHLERDVAFFGPVEAQIVAKEEEALASRGDLVDDVRQVHQVVLLHLDQAQALPRVLVEQALDDRRLAGAARAGEEHVVRRPALQELARVLLDPLDLPVDAAQVGELDAVHVRHRLQPARAVAPPARAPAERDARAPVGRRRGGRQQRIEAMQNFFELFAHVRYSALIFTESKEKSQVQTVACALPRPSTARTVNSRFFIAASARSSL